MTKSMVDSFIIKYERSRGKSGNLEPSLMKRNWTIVRIGSDMDTKYEIDGEEIGPLEVNGKQVKLTSLKKLDAVAELTQEVENYYGAQVQSKPKTTSIDEEDEELEEDSEEDEDEIEDAVDDEDEEADDEDDEEADDEEEDEEDEEEEPAPRRVTRKPLPTAKKPVARAKPVARRR
jgi:phosphopantothenoylcysteine synthetase/decarboxylase